MEYELRLYTFMGIEMLEREQPGELTSQGEGEGLSDNGGTAEVEGDYPLELQNTWWWFESVFFKRASKFQICKCLKHVWGVVNKQQKQFKSNNSSTSN